MLDGALVSTDPILIKRIGRPLTPPTPADSPPSVALSLRLAISLSQPQEGKGKIQKKGKRQQMARQVGFLSAFSEHCCNETA